MITPIKTCGLALMAWLLVAIGPLKGFGEPPSVALAPIAPEQLEGQEGSGESLTSVLVAALAGDHRWEMVERGDLSLLLAEWQRGGAGFGESANAVNQGRLLKADWVLVCRPEIADVEHPTATCEVIDAIRAEPLASHTVALGNRPHARWFRSPPASDVELLVRTSREVLAEALITRDERRFRKVVAPLFFVGDDGALALAIEEKLEAVKSTGGKWRLLTPLRPDVARGEGLLRAAGFVSGDGGPDLRRIADAYIWGRLEIGDMPGDIKKLRFSIWSGIGDPKETVVSGTPSQLAEAIHNALMDASVSVAGTEDISASQAKIAQRLVQEARAIFSESKPDYFLVRRLLETAVFFAPADREVQEMRLAVLLGLSAKSTHLKDGDYIRLWLEYARLADAFWQGAGNALDVRLLATSFAPQARNIPGQKERALRVAPLLVQAPLAELKPYGNLFSEWLVYARANPSTGQQLLEMIWPFVARLCSEKLYTRYTASANVATVGLVDVFREDQYIDQERFKKLVDGSLSGALRPVEDVDKARYRVVDSTAPALDARILRISVSKPNKPVQTGSMIDMGPNPEGFFKLLADYDAAKKSTLASEIFFEKIKAREAAQLQKMVVRLGADNPGVQAAFENQKKSHERRDASINRPVSAGLERLRQFTLQASKSGSIVAPQINDHLMGGATPLAVAVAKGWPEVVEILLAGGADPTDGRIGNQSIRDFAATNPDMMRVLGGSKPAPDHARGAELVDGAAVVAMLNKQDLVALQSVQLGKEILGYQDPRQWTVLHHAINLGLDDFALRLIAAGAPLEATSSGGQTPLAFAGFRARRSVAAALLEKGAKPNGRRSELSAPPLLAACIGGDLTIVRQLIAAGAEVNATSNGGVPLIVDAARDSKTYEAIKELVESGARLDVSDINDYGPMEASMVKDQVKTLNYLLTHGGKWRAARNDPDSSPLIIAARNNASQCLQLLVEKGERDIRAVQYASLPEIKALLEDKMQTTRSGARALNDQALWPVICADKEKWKERVEAYLAQGGDINFRSVNWTPLLLSIQTGKLEFVRYMISRGANPKVHPTGSYYEDRTMVDSDTPGGMKGADIDAYIAGIITIMVPLEPSDDYMRNLLRALRDKRWTVASAYVRAGIKVENEAMFKEMTASLTEAERLKARNVLNGN